MNPLKRIGNTIFKRMFFPIMLVLLLQGAVFLIVFFQGGIIDQSEENAFAILNEQVANRQRYLESEMTSRWSNLQESETLVLSRIQATLAAEHLPATAIAENAALNQRISEGIAEDLIYTLRKNGVTGAFVVLDGPAFAELSADEARSGVYLRNVEPRTSRPDNSDIMVERGPASISALHDITMDSFWETGFRFSGGQNDDYFFKPIEAMRSGEYDSSDSADFGYWAQEHHLHEKDADVISYSIPLALQGEVIGILGVDITMSYLQSMLPYDELDADKNGVYLIGVLEPGKEVDTVRRVTSNGPLYRAFFNDAEEFQAEHTDRDRIYRLTAADEKTVFYGNTHSFHLYNSNTPFEGDIWFLMGMQRESVLLYAAESMRNLTYLSTGVSLVLGTLGIFFASNLISRPISRLARRLRHSDPGQPLHLEKLNIAEIDLLSGSIEALSDAVAENSSKMSKTMEMVDLPIGLFEIDRAKKQVFCSRKFLQYTRSLDASSDRVITLPEFNELMQGLRDNIMDEQEGLFYLEKNGGQWLQLRQMEYGSLTMGALSDVTKEMREKQQIEYERDYDVLTNLFNRRAFHANVELLMDNPEYLQTAALIMWDIDNLKYVNDTYGHAVGDGYICAFAEIIGQFESSHSVVARRSGDEFYVFLYGYENRAAIEQEIHSVWQSMQNVSWTLPDGSSTRIRASAGVAWYPQDAKRLDDLIRYADFAMYNVKHTTKGRMRDFDLKTYQQNSVLVNGTEALNQLIEHQLVHFVMQPIFSAKDGSVYGYEMLMRSDMHQLPNVGEVLKLAEAQSKLNEIERLTFFGAMGTFVEQRKEGAIPSGVKVFLNSIGGQLLPRAVERNFEAEYGDYLSDIVIELTENQPTPEENIHAKLFAINKWNALVALDDYGTGYNNESSLLRISPNIVKVDISIISGIDHDTNKQEVMENLISYSKPRGIMILAEGVETEAELRWLLGRNVDLLQGYFLGRPAETPGVYVPEAVALLQELTTGI